MSKRIRTMDKKVNLPVLPQEKNTTEEEPPLYLAVPSNSLKGFPKAGTNGSCLLFESGIEKGNLFNNIEVVLWQLANPAKVFKSFFAFAL